MKLRDKVAFITGVAAPAGLGYAIAVAMGAEDATVAIRDINQTNETPCLGLRCDLAARAL